jgi:hypothetical protein
VELHHQSTLGIYATVIYARILKALVSAAADHPLSIINGDVLFEKESFLRRILEFAEPQGKSV